MTLPHLASFAMPVWYGLMAPAGTSREATALLNREIERVLKEPEIRERFTTLGVAPTGGAPADALIVDRALEDPSARSGDLGGRGSTSTFGEAVARAL